MFLDGGFQQFAFRVFVYRLRPFKVRVCVVDEPVQHVASVMVQGDHQVVVALRQRLELHAARKVIVGVGVPYRKQRGDGLHRWVAGAGQKIRGGPQVRDAGGAHNAAGPRLRDDPLHHFAAVVAFARRAEAVARAETCARAAHVDHDDGVSTRHEVIPELGGIGRAFADPVRVKLEAAVVRREQHDGGKLRGRRIITAFGLAFRDIDINRQAAAIAHRQVAGTRRWDSVNPGSSVRVGLRRDHPGHIFVFRVRRHGLPWNLGEKNARDTGRGD
ncbi:hypothetical protein D3C71_1338180 [compost metagenome]